MAGNKDVVLLSTKDFSLPNGTLDVTFQNTTSSLTGRICCNESLDRYLLDVASLDTLSHLSSNQCFNVHSIGILPDSDTAVSGVGFEPPTGHM